MTRQISEDDLARLSACLTDQVGLHFPRERWQDMERGIRSAAREFEFHDPKLCLEWLLASPLSRRQVEVLASHLTVGETYFFREKALFEVLEKRILPELIGSRLETSGRLRIWSAGCASGEEPYSIAIALNRTIGSESARKAMILATDIKPRALEKAAAGIFGDWSFRDASPRLKEMYFENKGRHYEILRAIQQQVQFSFVNLAEDAYPSLANKTNAMDIIFCRNVLMYFSPEQTRKVVRKFYRSLVEGGWLIVSPCEGSAALFSEFNSVHFPGAILYQKRAADTSRTIEEFRTTGPGLFRPQEYCDFATLPTGRESLNLPSVETVAPQAGVPPPAQEPSSGIDAAQALYTRGFYARAIEALEGGEGVSHPDPMALALAAPLLEISGVAERVAAGDLTVSLPTNHRGDEVGALARTFRKMVENLREVNRQILEGVSVLASSSSEILASTTQVASAASQELFPTVERD